MLVRDAREMALSTMWKNGLSKVRFDICDIDPLGLCICSKHLFFFSVPQKILLQRTFVALNSPEIVKDVLIHEIAHARSGIRRDPHDWRWEKEYRKLGGLGDDVITPQIVFVDSQIKWTATCGRCDGEMGAVSVLCGDKLSCTFCGWKIPHEKWSRAENTIPALANTLEKPVPY